MKPYEREALRKHLADPEGTERIADEARKQDAETLARFGGRVLEILRDRDARQRECRPPSATIDVTALGDCLRAARSLGLLDSEAQP